MIRLNAINMIDSTRKEISINNNQTEKRAEKVKFNRREEHISKKHFIDIKINYLHFAAF